MTEQLGASDLFKLAVFVLAFLVGATAGSALYIIFLQDRILRWMSKRGYL